jgi:hypothetical protein
MAGKGKLIVIGFNLADSNRTICGACLLQRQEMQRFGVWKNNVAEGLYYLGKGAYSRGTRS